MRMRALTLDVRARFIAFVLILLSCVPATAGADPIAAAYGDALRTFNPQLSPDTAERFAERVIVEADAQALDARLLVALIATESAGRPDAVSPAGALGLGQLMPATASGLAVDPTNAEENIHGVALELRSLLDRYRAYDRQTQYVLALAAYNAGPGAVERYGGVPPYAETRAYVRGVIRLWRRLAGVPD
jgi:soluble lytic murein transglycosylase-like protein